MQDDKQGSGVVVCEHKECRYKYSLWEMFRGWLTISRRVKVCACGWRQVRWWVELERGGAK